MADRKISDLTALTTPASGDYVPIVDISEAAAASKNKRVTIQNLFQGIPVNVGIGTGAPSYLLHANTSAAADVELAVQNSAGLARYGTRTSGNACAGSFTAGKAFELWSANAQAVTIDSNGRVGIGTGAPSYLLHANTSAATDVELAVQNSAGLARYGTRTSGNACAGSFTAGKAFELWSANAQAVTIDSNGRVGIGTASPTKLLDVNADTVRVRTARTPASASATGATGEICWDDNYIYVCTATNTWKRAALSTW